MILRPMQLACPGDGDSPIKIGVRTNRLEKMARFMMIAFDLRVGILIGNDINDSDFHIFF